MRTTRGLFLLGFLFLAPLAVPEAKPPKVLRQILHCAGTDKFGLLQPVAKPDGILQVAWAHKVRSEPYVDEFFVVLYKSATEGDILVYSREYTKGKMEFHLGNNARFVIRPDKVELIDPLWGMWTRHNIERNVKRAMRGPTYSIPAKTIVGPFRNVGCYSYPDP